MDESNDDSLQRLNSLRSGEAESELLKCCGSQKWAARMSGERPFGDVDDLLAKADHVWWSLEPREWLEAFHSHPKIGEQKAATATAVEAQKWSEAEQSGVRNSAQEILETLAELNRVYEQKFGFIFIVCATGKSSAEMLAILRARLESPAAQELHNAAAEQAKITELRLRKLIGQ